MKLKQKMCALSLHLSNNGPGSGNFSQTTNFYLEYQSIWMTLWLVFKMCNTKGKTKYLNQWFTQYKLMYHTMKGNKPENYWLFEQVLLFNLSCHSFWRKKKLKEKNISLFCCIRTLKYLLLLLKTTFKGNQCQIFIKYFTNIL